MRGGRIRNVLLCKEGKRGVIPSFGAGDLVSSDIGCGGGMGQEALGWLVIWRVSQGYAPWLVGWRAGGR